MAQTNRYLKLSCDCCGWTARTTKKHIGAAPALHCAVPDCIGELKHKVETTKED